MIAVTQNMALGMSAVPLAAGALLPTDVAAAKESDFCQVMAAVDAAVLSPDTSGPATTATAASGATGIRDQPELNADETIPDNAILPIFAQFLMVPHMRAAGAPVAAPVSALLQVRAQQATRSECAVLDPTTQITHQVKQAVAKRITKVGDAAENDVLAHARPDTSTDPANLKPSPQKEIAQPVLVQATASANNRALLAPTPSDGPNTIVPVAADLRRSNIVSAKSDIIDLTDASVAGTVSKPDAAQNLPTNATSEPPAAPARAMSDAHSFSQLSEHGPKPDTPPSTAENAWRQRWIGTDQRAVTKDVVEDEGTTAPRKGISFSSTSADASQHWLGKLAVAAIPQAPIAAEPVPPPLAAKTTTLITDANISRQAAEALTAQVTVAKHLEDTPLVKLSIEAPGIGAAAPPPSAAASFPAVPSASAVAAGIPPALTPAIIEMTKSSNDGPLELALSPEELGRVAISIRQEGDFVRVTIAAERFETLDLLRRHASDLIADLRQSGFSGASLSFAHGGQGQPARFAENSEAANDQLQSPSPETRPPVPNRSSKGSGVDLRF